MPRKSQADTILTLGIAGQCLGLIAAYLFVTGGVSSALVIWVPTGAGLLLSVIWLVRWCRQVTIRKRLTLVRTLLLFGFFTFCVAVFVGHAVGVLLLIAVPALLAGVALAVSAGATALLVRLRTHRNSHSGC